MVETFEPLLLKELIQNLPPEMIGRISTLVTIFQALGIIFIVYFIFLIVKIVFDVRSKIMIRKTYEKVNEIDEKINGLIKKKSRKKIKTKDL